MYERMEPAWPGGTATGVGSFPGTDLPEALRVVFGEVPDFPYLPELPARGPDADMIGRGGALLADLHVDLQPSGWRLVDRPGREVRQARDLLRRDLDDLQTAADGYAGPLKVQVCGPWTLAAGVELTRGERAVADLGACRDLGQSLAEGLRRHLAELAGRVPGAEIVVQVDEPSLPAVLAGTVRTASGYGALRAVDEPEARTVLTGVFDAVSSAGQVPVGHCCARRPPIAVLRETGARAVSVDLGGLDGRDEDAVGEAVEAGTNLMLGLVPATDSDRPTDRLAEQARGLWRRLGFAPERLPATVVVTPTCGMTGASPGYAAEALRVARAAARELVEAPDA